MSADFAVRVVGLKLTKEREEVLCLERKVEDSLLELSRIREETGSTVRESFDNTVAQLLEGNPDLRLYHVAFDCLIQGGRLC